MKSRDRPIWQAIAGILIDLLVLGGAALVSLGAYMIYEPAGYIVAGAFACGIGILLCLPMKGGGRK